jgi:hypothetical protein
MPIAPPPADEPLPVGMTPPDDVADSGKAQREGRAAASTSDPDELETTAAIRRPPEDDPFAALGLRAGGFIFLPAVDVTAGYTSNAAGIAGGTASGTWTVAPDLYFKSDWAEHEATLRLRGSYQQFTDGITESQPTATIAATGRVDLPDEWRLDVTAGYNFQNQSVSDPNFPAGVDEAPGVHDLITTAAVTGDFGRFELTVQGAVERTVYENGMAGMVVVDQGDRTNNRYGLSLRAGYEMTPSITPFVEGELAWRVYDRPIDDEGIRRSSQGEAIRAGLAFDRDPFLKGEIAVGARRERFDDASLATLRALTVDGSLVWRPTRLTTVTLNASTGFNPSTVELDYAWRRNVTLKANAGVKDEHFQGIDLENRTYSAGLGWVWKLNRTLHLTAGYIHQWLVSSDPAGDYQSDAVSVGLRVQR